MQYTFPDTLPIPSDTIARDNLDMLMNDITRKYF